MATLPRGIRVIQWKNKDGSKSLRYRIRQERKNKDGILEITDKSFDTLAEAEEFLKLSKTVRGRELIYSKTEEELKRKDEIKAFLAEPPLSIYIDRYVKKFIDTKDQSNYTKRRNVYTLKNFYKTICNTEIEYRHKLKHGGLGGMLDMITINPKKKLGQFKISEIGATEVNDYIRTRLAHTTSKGTPLKKSSVAREVSLFSVFFRELAAGEFGKEHEGIDNPALKYNKKLLANANIKRKFVLTQEMEKTLFDELAKTKNPELLAICKLSLYTAMRRSEIIYLTWEQVDFEHAQIHLTHTKSNRPRDVYILPEVAELLKNIPKRENDPKVFKTPLSGFEGTFSKLKARIGLKAVRFHDLRRQAIRNMILKLAGATGNANNSVIIAQLLGMNSPKKLEENHINPLLDSVNNGISTQQQALKHIGHFSSDETAGYFNI
ncbi:site-specific integrase [Burkholderia vietnamiensis]|uniref:site-specific integrase n=1 Tax=Burkholderia vietnamiensis TaxID=60552 RepID=UPI00265491FD|nr:site-specific integrase [Burkholderia vietnamiensis]MDN7815969.1 site-specific integrase [Burkholderia vietnamiensis]